MKSKGKIFLLDDEDLIVSVLSKALKKEGYEVYAETETDDVMNKIKSWGPDVILLDIRMPDLSALEIFAEINKIKPGLKVLIMSGDPEDERIGELLSIGCIGFIPKPFSVNLLDQKIRENLCA